MTEEEFIDLVQQRFIPTTCGRFPVYFKVGRHMTWNTFLSLFPVKKDCEWISGWKNCRQCQKTWSDISTLSTTDGEPVYCGQPLEDYPPYYMEAIKKYQESFRAAPITDTVINYVPLVNHNSPPNIGHKSLGIMDYDSEFPHCFLKTGLINLSPKDTDLSDKVAVIIHNEIANLERYLSAWDHEVILKILNWYDTKGETAAGYRVNILGLRFINQIYIEFAKDLKESYLDKRIKRVIVLRHMLILFSGKHPDDAIGGIHIFANSSNLAACRKVSEPEEFWRVMDARYNPIKYRRAIAPPKLGAVKATLAQVGNDLSCFERRRLTVDNVHVINHCIWRECEPEIDTSISSTRLLDLVKTKLAERKAPSPIKTCFSSSKSSTAIKKTPDEFEVWLKTLPSGTRMKHNISPYGTIYPIELAEPTTQKGRDMLKVPIGWTIPPKGILANKEYGWLNVKSITTHPGRWRIDEDGSHTTVPREQSIICDGYVIEMNHSWRSPSSCMFPQFFRGKYHGMDTTINELNNTLRMSDPPGDIFRGIVLEVKKTPEIRGGWSTKTMSSQFQAILPCGQTQLVTII